MKRVKAVASFLFILAFVVGIGNLASAQTTAPVGVAVGLQAPVYQLYGVTAPVNECVAVLSIDNAGGLLAVAQQYVPANTTTFVAFAGSLNTIPVTPFFVYYTPIPLSSLGIYIIGFSVGGAPLTCIPPTLAGLSTDLLSTTLTDAPKIWLTATEPSDATIALSGGGAVFCAGPCGGFFFGASGASSGTSGSIADVIFYLFPTGTTLGGLP